MAGQPLGSRFRNGPAPGRNRQNVRPQHRSQEGGFCEPGKAKKRTHVKQFTFSLNYETLTKNVDAEINDFVIYAHYLLNVSF